MADWLAHLPEVTEEFMVRDATPGVEAKSNHCAAPAGFTPGRRGRAYNERPQVEAAGMQAHLEWFVVLRAAQRSGVPHVRRASHGSELSHVGRTKQKAHSLRAGQRRNR